MRPLLALLLIAQLSLACDSSDSELDASVPTDLGGRDLGSPDLGRSDAHPADTGEGDATPLDAEPSDAGPSDADPLDAGGCPSSAPLCDGVCALIPPRCEGTDWICDQGPGFEAVETTCDGFDNDCDGERDEGCPVCVVQEAELRDHLFSIADLDFDSACNGYLTSLVSGPDYTWVVPGSGAPASQYFGQANQNMGYALVDPDPTTERVVVTYSCCENCGCLAQNGLTLLHTCTATQPGCGCAGQTNCPGFLDAPFLAAGYEDLVTPIGTLTTPTGLAVGPGGAYFVGNWRPASCGSDPSCVSCGPDDETFCLATDVACCDDTAFGRLAQFTLPRGSGPASFRVVAIFPGSFIMGLASGRSGELMVGLVTMSGGALHRYDPVQGSTSLVRSFTGAIRTITQDRRSGDWYLEEVGTSSSTLHRLSEQGAPLALPNTVPAHPSGVGALEYGPDHRLYRVELDANAPSVLDVWVLP